MGEAPAFDFNGSEVVAWSKGVAEKPIVISGPSGVGKGTLITRLLLDFPSTYGVAVSHTTRRPRDNEQDGVHYNFVERENMEKGIREGKFLESATYSGNLYGTSLEAVQKVARGGKRCILEIDVQGAISLRARSFEAVFIFIRPPSVDDLGIRLRSRTDTAEQIQKRVDNGKAELVKVETSPGLYDHVLVNKDFEKCYENLKKLLSLDNCVKNDSESAMVHVPLGHAVSQVDQNCEATEQEKSAENTNV